MKLRSHLVALTLVALVPVAMLAVILGMFLVEKQRETFRRGTEERVLAISTAVDSELKGSIDTLRALAQVSSLDRGDLRLFRESAAQVLASQEHWLTINLAFPDGQQLMNARIPEGTPLPKLQEAEATLRQLAETLKPVVNDLVIGRVSGRWDFGVRVPVVRDGKLVYVLSAVIDPDSITRLLNAQGLPAGWVGTVLDRSGRTVARTAAAQTSVGQLPSEDLRQALKDSSGGWFRGTTRDGREAYRAYRRSDATGWTFAMAIPVAAVEATSNRALWIFALALAGAIALAVVLAQLVGRRIAKPIAALASATDRLASGEDVQVRDSGRIDELGALEKALRNAAGAQVALRDADRHKDEFLAMLSHELRNPLAALTTAAHVLRVAKPGDTADASARGVIERQAEHMARLIEDLLDLTRVRLGKLSLKRQALDLAALASQVVQSWRAAGRLDGRATVSVDLSPVWVSADHARMEQIVANLLDNALKFTPARGEIRVRVSQEADKAVMQVADNGRGIAHESLSRIFDPFVQGEQSLGRGEGGLGLGLALVKRLAELHDGSVSVESDGEGRGAVFNVWIPAVAAPRESRPARSRLESRASPRRVLVIEDNQDARQMLRALLGMDGHEVREAKDGASGLRLAAEANPDVVVIDIGLPDIDGYEVARRLRARAGSSAMALIALSGYGGEDVQGRAHAAGFDVHLVKPVSVERLALAIAEVASSRAMPA
jgi:signal transduction histidine kinase/ActR/RegA family two-component response regulator